MGHGEDPPPGKPTECTPERDTGEGEDDMDLCQSRKYLFVYVEVCCNSLCPLQVNSKGYKVCGEASSVCGTITINKRKVGFHFFSFIILVIKIVWCEKC